MEIVFNLALTFTFIFALMMLFDILLDKTEFEYLTESTKFKAIGGATILLSILFWFVFILTLIWI